MDHVCVYFDFTLDLQREVPVEIDELRMNSLHPSCILLHVGNHPRFGQNHAVDGKLGQFPYGLENEDSHTRQIHGRIL